MMGGPGSQLLGGVLRDVPFVKPRDIGGKFATVPLPYITDGS